jgi:hypothetical protein
METLSIQGLVVFTLKDNRISNILLTTIKILMANNLNMHQAMKKMKKIKCPKKRSERLSIHFLHSDMKKPKIQIQIIVQYA